MNTTRQKVSRRVAPWAGRGRPWRQAGGGRPERLTAMAVAAVVAAGLCAAVPAAAADDPAPAPAQAAIANLALGKPVHASSNNPIGFKERAVDGDTSTHWATDSAMREAWIYVDLEDVYDLTQTRVLFTVVAPGGLYKYQIEGSIDAEEWEVLADHSEGVALTGGERPSSGAIPLPNLDEWQADEVEGDYRYVRLSIVDSGANDWPSIYELEVSGDGIPATVASVDNPPGQTVRLGRTADSLSLPTEVTVTDGAAGRQAQAGVTWDTTGYDPDTAGEYTFTGQLVNLPEFWSNPGGIGAQVTVTVLDQAVVDDRQSETLTFLGDRYSAVLDCGGKAALTSLQVFGRETLDQQAGGGVYSSVVLAAEDPATVNLAMGKATHTSSNNGNTMAGAKAVDGDAGTYWCANGGSFPQSLIVDLGAAAELGLVWQLFADRDNSTYKYQVRGSNDASVLTGSEWNQASKWAVLADRSAGVQQSGAVPTADAVSGTYRYVQLYVTAASNGHWASASEFEVFAEGAPEPTGPRTVTSLDLDESPEIVLDGDTAVVAFSTDAADETWTLTADADKLVFTLDRQYKTGGTLSQQGTPLATYGENAWESMRWAEDGGSYPLGGTSALANLGSWISNPNNGYRLTKEQTSYALLNGATGTALDVAVTQNHAIEGAARGAAGYRTGATEVWRASRGLRLATVVSSAMLDYAGGGDPALTGGISRGYYNAPGCGGQTFATHRHFAADSPLRPSGLLGPVSLLTRG